MNRQIALVMLLIGAAVIGGCPSSEPERLSSKPDSKSSEAPTLASTPTASPPSVGILQEPPGFRFSPVSASIEQELRGQFMEGFAALKPLSFEV